MNEAKHPIRWPSFTGDCIAYNALCWCVDRREAHITLDTYEEKNQLKRNETRI